MCYKPKPNQSVFKPVYFCLKIDLVSLLASGGSVE